MPRGRPKPLSEKLWPSDEEKPRRWSDDTLNPDVEPWESFLRDVRERTFDRTPKFSPTVKELIQYLPPVDLAAIKRCAKDLLRFHDAKRNCDIVVPSLCGNYYCPRCPHFEHAKRVLYHARKVASLDPTSDQPVPRIVNTVWTLPPELHDWARRDPRFMPAWRRAILRTIAEVYGYKGKAGYPVDRVAFKELGAIMNLHAIGDEAKPWPKWNPHYDVIMPAWKRVGGKIEPLRTTWPDRPYAKTNARYRDSLRHCLLPLALRPNRMVDLETFLRSDFQTVWHVSRPPRTDSNPDGTGVVHQESAMHRIRYSCRPLFVITYASHQETDGKKWLRYRVERGRREGTLIHRVPLGPALGQLESLREWMSGRASRSWAGILSRSSYDEAAKLAGHEPIRPKVKKGFVLTAVYELGDDKKYIRRKAGPGAHGSPREDHEDDA
ncbi:MAG TPA: hypothetical protein VFH78_06965 [Candidatus Thermoplasmatota archaeon]|nr:hypothetical protein [Candidatus Thermoplasmatota archaeon]